ncbi:MAG TPA: hypothetical protein VEU96_15170 [Bryobacteraceae bacterium]|nr:hypothetical protein [Bryobacteraceae bacterium]
MTWRNGAIGLAMAGCLVFLGDAAVFRTGLYFLIEEPDTAASVFEREMRLELARRHDGRKQILIVGDSRAQCIRPRIAEEGLKQRETAFANVAVLGSSVRSWYYLLRELDPEANRYNAVVIGVDSFDDNNHSFRGESTAEVEMPVASLHVKDLFDYPWTYQRPAYRRDAFLECLLKGSAYKRDFMEFLSSPLDRMTRAVKSREHYGPFMWDYVGADWSMAGLEVDWAARKVKFPDAADAPTRDIMQDQVEHYDVPDDPAKTVFRREWLGRIARHYRGSRTILVFVRLLSTPIPPPAELQRTPLHGMLRDLPATQSNVLLLDEHLFDRLQHPEFFRDYTHLNAMGATEASKIFADQVPLILARAAGVN